MYLASDMKFSSRRSVECTRETDQMALCGLEVPRAGLLSFSFLHDKLSRSRHASTSSRCLESRAVLAVSFSSYRMNAWALRRRASSVVGVSMPTALAKSLCGRSPRSSKYFFIFAVAET